LFGPGEEGFKGSFKFVTEPDFYILLGTVAVIGVKSWAHYVIPPLKAVTIFLSVCCYDITSLTGDVWSAGVPDINYLKY